MIKTIVDKIFNEYSKARQETFSGHPLGAFFRNEISKIIYSTGIVDSNSYLVTGSVGLSKWADSAWFAIFDRKITTSAREGVYIVYLLSKDGNTLYLTFNQGSESIKKEHTKKETINIMRSKAAEVVSKIDSRGFQMDENMDLGSGLSQRAELYQKGTIFYKEYKKGNVPPEEKLRNDLTSILAIYTDYATMYQSEKESTEKYGPGTVKGQENDSGIRIGKFDSWEIVDENTAIKQCDKSFFEYNGSGVPRGICWFFDAEKLKSGDYKQLKLIFNGNEYIGKVSNESTDRQRVRIFWNADLGKLFATYKGTKGIKAKFNRISEDVFEVMFKAGGTEMTIKEKITEVKSYIASKGFNYEGDLIENFYLSLKSKPFVILAGISGTGKTRLVKLFAEAIGAKMKLVPVRPDWSDSSDMFGYTDLSSKFQPGVIIDFIKQAEWDKETPYFLCLDEMNLARVEYYFSDFLSVIETRNRKANGDIETAPLVDMEYYKDTEAKTKYGRVFIPENLYIIGTVNMDETTFPFSKKVLDRANTIEFSYVNLIPQDSFPQPREGQVLDNSFLKTEYLYLHDCKDLAFVNSVCFTLEELNSILVKANLHVGYRVRDEICFYMMNNKIADLLTENAAFDHEIMQKILPRIQGSSESIKNGLAELFIKCAGDYTKFSGTMTYEQMNSYIDAKDCKYPNSAQKIAFMMRRYEEDGFTSYWL